MTRCWPFQYFTTAVKHIKCWIGYWPCQVRARSNLCWAKVTSGQDSMTVFEALEKRVATFVDKDKQYAIVLDEMAITSGLSYDATCTCDGVEGTENYGHLRQTKYMANHALAIVVRGLSQKWKQYIGYFLSSGPISGDKLKDIIFNGIRKLSDIGLNVHVQGANNRNFLSTILDISVDKPYFECSDRKIVVIYDSLHLLKNIRNNFEKHGFVHGDDSIQWEHVNFFNFDRRGGRRMAPKLTAQHIYLPMFTKMSQTCSSGIEPFRSRRHYHACSV